MHHDLIDSFTHKIVRRKRRNSDLNLRTSQSLFSAHAVDPGTNLLLRTIASSRNDSFEHCLDVGCGYGVLGLSLVAQGIAREVTLIDRDAMALEFARINATENEIKNITFVGSLGLDGLSDGDFDLIVSNLPGKAGDQVLRQIILSSMSSLRSGGEFWAVVVKPLWAGIEQLLEEHGIGSQQVSHGPRHTVFGISRDDDAQLSEVSAGFPDEYFRGQVQFEVSGHAYTIQTSHGLPEFDELSYSSQLLLDQLYQWRKRKFANAAVFNVTHGYVPLALLAADMIDVLHISDRDLLSLQTTEMNLSSAGFNRSAITRHHIVPWLPVEDTKYNLVAGTLRGDEPREALKIGLESVKAGVARGGIALIAGGSTPVTRMQDSLAKARGFQVVARERHRGASVIAFTRN